MKFFSKKLLGHEIFELYSPLGYKIFFEKLVKPCGLPSYKLNVHSRISDITIKLFSSISNFVFEQFMGFAVPRK